jgi:putative ABC transport system substrate-binding protein
MNRRELLLLAASAMTAARTLRAQQKAMPVIGVLSSTTPGSNAANVAAFRQGLSETGYVEGQNLAIEYRWAEGHYDRLPGLAADLVGAKVDVIATGGTPSVLAAKSATSTIPIVFSSGDPIEGGVIASLSRPGGNLTGVSAMNTEMTPKRLELLSELVPQAKVIALLVNPNTAVAERIIREVQEAARAKRLQLHT